MFRDEIQFLSAGRMKQEAVTPEIEGDWVIEGDQFCAE